MTTMLRSPNRAIEAIETVVRSGLQTKELLEEAARIIDEVVPSDGCFLAATDPQTTLSIGTGVIYDLPKCSRTRPTQVWRRARRRRSDAAITPDIRSQMTR